MTEVIDRHQAQTAAVAEYSATEAALADLRSRFKDVAFDMSTTKGDKEARAARSELVKLRTTLDARRKEIKAPLLERSKLIDAEASRITEAIKALEAPIDAQIKAAEAAKEAERKRKEERAALIQNKISAIRAHLGSNVASDSTALSTAIEFVESIQVSEAEFGEYEQAADRAKIETLKALKSLQATAIARETQAAVLAEAHAAIAAKQAELDRLLAEAKEAARAAAAKAEADAKAAAEAQAAADKAAADLRAAAEAQAKAILDKQRAAAAALEYRAKKSAPSILISLKSAISWMEACSCLDVAGQEIVGSSRAIVDAIEGEKE